MKLCTKCNTKKPRVEFHKNRRANDGLDWRCKVCKRTYVNKHLRQKREKAYYAENRKGFADKAKARFEARHRWGDYMKLDPCCEVLGCYQKAEELAHLDYNYPTDVLALCKHHHRMLDRQI